MTQINSESTRNSKTWLLIFVGTVLLLATALTIAQVRVDPFGIWNTPTEQDFNFVKQGQHLREAFFKPYQYATTQPDVVVLGNSRAVFGIAPVWYSKTPKTVYNFGYQACRINEIEQIVDFVLRMKHPEAIVFMLNPVILARGDRTDQDRIRGIDYPDRLAAISMGWLPELVFKLKESVFSIDAISLSLETIETNQKPHRDTEMYLGGWRQWSGQSVRTNIQGYIKDFWIYHRANKSFNSNLGTFKKLERMVKKIRAAGVKPIVVFEPLTADLQLSIDSYNRLGVFGKMKSNLLKVTPFWDFAYLNTITSQRKNYIDSHHYRGIVGDLILRRINDNTEGVPDDFGVWVTKSNFTTHLKQARKRFENWKLSQSSLANLLERHQAKKDESAFKTELRQQIPHLFR